MSARSVANVSINLGMLNIPCKLYLSASQEDISLNLLSPDGKKLSQQYVDPDGKVIPREDMLRGYKVGEDEYVTFTSEEVKSLQSDGTAVELKRFIPSSQLPQVYIEKGFYVKPDPKQYADKQYILLSKILKKKNLTAIGTWVNRGKNKLIAVSSYNDGIIMYQLYFKNEVRGFDLNLKTVNISDQEMTMAEMLVSAMTEDNHDLGQYEDDWNNRIHQAIESKKNNGAVIAPIQVSNTTGSLDLIDKLKAMLDQQKAILETQKNESEKPVEPVIPTVEIPTTPPPAKRRSKKSLDKTA